jgi:hypothetical protein
MSEPIVFLGTHTSWRTSRRPNREKTEFVEANEPGVIARLRVGMQCGNDRALGSLIADVGVHTNWLNPQFSGSSRGKPRGGKT